MNLNNLMNLRSIDYDNDSIPYLDSDSDTGGIRYDIDSNLYSKGNFGFAIKSNSISPSKIKKKRKYSNTKDIKSDTSSPNEVQKASNEFIVYFKDVEKLICDKV